MAPVVREFRSDDFETLWRLDQECFPPGVAYSRRELKAYIRSRGSFALVAIDGDDKEAKGFIVAHSGSAGHIVTIDVSAQARRAGVGTLLLRAAEDRLRASGARSVGLE